MTEIARTFYKKENKPTWKGTSIKLFRLDCELT